MSTTICPDDCAGVLAEFSFDPCSPEWNRGEVGIVYMYSIGYPVVANPKTDPAGFIAEMALRVSNTSANPDAIRKLVVIGEKPEPEKTTIKMSGDREIVTNKKHSLMFNIDELSQANRDAQRQSECVNKYLLMWENGDLLFGGSDNIGDGVEAVVTMDTIVPLDRGALDYIKCTAVWNDKFSPDSCTNPLI